MQYWSLPTPFHQMLRGLFSSLPAVNFDNGIELFIALMTRMSINYVILTDCPRRIGTFENQTRKKCVWHTKKNWEFRIKKIDQNLQKIFQHSRTYTLTRVSERIKFGARTQQKSGLAMIHLKGKKIFISKEGPPQFEMKIDV